MNLPSSKNWKTIKLGEVVKIKHGYAFKGEYFSDEPTKNILLTPGNFMIGGGWKEGKKYYSDDAEIPNEYILKGGELVVSMTDLSKAGDTLGYSALVPMDSEKIFLHNQRIGLVEVKENNAYKNFIYYMMRSHPYQRYIVNSATGSTVKHTSPTRILDYEFSLPPIEDQRSIAALLGSLDDKIELLRAENGTLERMAQTIFKEWFVDFRFPGATGVMVDSELGKIPKGWRVEELGKLFKITMGQSPSGESYNENKEGLTFYQGRTDFGERFPSVRLYTTEPKRIAEAFDVLVSVRAPVGDINQATEKCCLGRGVAGVSSNLKSFCFYMMKSVQSEIQKFEAGGTVFGSINKADFENIKVVIPPADLQDRLNQRLRPIDEKVFNNFSEIETLSKSRDGLLSQIFAS